MAETTSESPPSTKWTTIALTGLISLVVGVASAVIIDYVRTSAAKLEYDIISTNAFPGQTQKIALAAIQLRNSGRKELELVTAKITAKGAEIVESQIEGFPLKGLSETKTKDTYSIELPFLNPSESGRILLLYNMTAPDFPPPTVELRAKGVSGTQQAKDKMPATSAFWLAIPAALATLMSFTVIRRIRDKGFTTVHYADQRDIGAYVLDIYSLHEEATTLRNGNRKTTYWALADSLTTTALLRADAEHTRRVANALETIMQYAKISDTSCFLLNYNLARLYNCLGKTAEAKAALEKARKENHKVIDMRIALTEDLRLLAPVSLTLPAKPDA